MFCGCMLIHSCPRVHFLEHKFCSFLPSFPSFSLPTFPLTSFLPHLPNFLNCTIVITLLDPSAVWPSASRSAFLFRFLSQPPFLDFWIPDLSTFGHPYHDISTAFSLESVLRVSFVAFTSHPLPFLTPPSDSRTSSSFITSSLSRKHLLSTISNIERSLYHP